MGGFAQGVGNLFGAGRFTPVDPYAKKPEPAPPKTTLASLVQQQMAKPAPAQHPVDGSTYVDPYGGDNRGGGASAAAGVPGNVAAQGRGTVMPVPRPAPQDPTPAPAPMPQPTPPTPAPTIAQRAPEYEGALKALIEKQMGLIDGRIAAQKAAVNPYTPTSDAYTARVTQANNQHAAQDSAAPGRLRAALASRGMLGTGMEAAAMANQGARAAASRSSDLLGLRGQLDDRSAAWDLDHNRALDALATGGFGGPQSAMSGILSAAINQGNSDRSFDYQAGRDDRGDFVDDRSFNYGVGRDAVGDERYDDTTGYARGRDAVADARYGTETDYAHGRDDVADQRDTRDYNARRADAEEAKRQYEDAVARGDKRAAEQSMSNIVGLGFKLVVIGGLAYLTGGAGLAAAPAILQGDPILSGGFA